MDIMTGAGLVGGLAVIVLMVFMGGDLGMFLSDHAAIIIFGGSGAATMIRFPLSVLMHGLPLGIQAQAKQANDGLLLQLAAQVERAIGGKWNDGKVPTTHVTQG